MTRALRIASLFQLVGWGLVIFWIGDANPHKSPNELIIGIVCIFAAIPFVFINNKYRLGSRRNRVQIDYSRSLDKQLANKIIEAEITSRANATIMIPGMQPYGPGKLFGSPNGELFWIGDSGYQLNIENNVRDWGSSKFKPDSKDLYITLTTVNEFSISEDDSFRWIPWLERNYPGKAN